MLVWLFLFLCLSLMLSSAPVSALAQQPESKSARSEAMKGADDNVLEIEPILILGTRGEHEAEASANVTILKKDDVAQSPMLVLDDLLRQIPGFNTFRRSSSLVTAPAQDPEAQGVSLRGIGPGGASRALVLVDGVPVNDGYGGWLYWGEVPLENIERVEVVRGANAALWGNFAMGGVINVVTKSPRERSSQAKLSVGNHGTTDNDLSYSDRLGPVSIGLRGNFLHTDGWNIIAPSQRGPIDQNSNMERKVFNGRMEYAASADLTLFVRGSYYAEDRNTGTPFRTSNTGRGYIVGGGNLKTMDGSAWQLQVFSRFTRFNEQYSSANESRTAERPTQIQEVPSTDFGGSLTWTRTFFTDHLVTAGTDARVIIGQSNDQFFNATGTAIATNQVSAGKQTFNGFFVQDIYSPIPRLQLIGAARVDYFQNYDGQITTTSAGQGPVVSNFASQNRALINPKLAFHYRLSEDWAIRGGSYTAFRVPTLSELYRQSSVEALVLQPNPTLGPEFLKGGEVGVDYWGKGPLRARLTGFWNNLRNPVGNMASIRDPVTGEDTERTRANIGRARVRGVEADAQYQLPWGFTLTASYLYTEALVTENPQDPDLVGKRLAQVPLHSATVGVQYTNPALFNALVQWRYVGNQFEDADNHDALGSYYVVDMSASRDLPKLSFLSERQPGQLVLGIQNLFNRHYNVDRGGDIFKTGTPFLITAALRLQF